MLAELLKNNQLGYFQEYSRPSKKKTNASKTVFSQCSGIMLLCTNESNAFFEKYCKLFVF